MNKQLRRIKYIDKTLQGRLMFALVLLESVMISIAMIYLYHRFVSLITDRMYSIHPAHQDNFLQLLISELSYVVLIMSVVNIIALVVANVFWGRHVEGIISTFRARLERMGQLDLRRPQQPQQPDHDVIFRLEDWRRLQAQRMSQIRRLCQTLLDRESPQALVELKTLIEPASSPDIGTDTGKQA
jgi:hypothetical protein